MSATHHCDPSADPRGGLVTLARVVRAIVASMDGRLPEEIAEFDECRKCRTLFAITMSNADARMGYELQLAAVQAAIDRGETETPADGL